jgi:hypothetical protein
MGRRAKAVGSCIVWWEGALKLSGLVLCGAKAWYSRRVMCCVVGRRTDAVSGLALCAGKAY